MGLILEELNSNFLQHRLGLYAEAVKKVRDTDKLCWIYRHKMIEVARPGDNGMQNVVYNGQKGKHALKFQVIVAPDCTFLHEFGPLIRRRNDWV